MSSCFVYFLISLSSFFIYFGFPPLSSFPPPQIWLDNDLDMKLKPYKCIATGVTSSGEGVGMIEVVMGSDTTSGIQLKYGGGAIGALKLDPLDLFIRAHNPDEASYNRAVDNFLRSCAGYCVATFVLGIGDRHNGNIMVTKEGHLFHIDFGHFLGNFKSKFGFNRERSAFVFTPEMAFVMGGRKYKSSPLFKTFKECCFKAFNTLRKHAATLENLFLLVRKKRRSRYSNNTNRNGRTLSGYISTQLFFFLFLNLCLML